MDGKVMRLIALVEIAAGDEITTHYISERDLMEPLESRRRKLENWGFQCACCRCSEEAECGDPARAFRCSSDSCKGIRLALGESLGPCSFCRDEVDAGEMLLEKERDHAKRLAE